MRVQLVFAHPLDDSYGSAIAKTACAALEHAGHSVVFTDLYREGFDPRLTPEERSRYYGGDYDTRGVARYVDEVRRAEMLVFVFPHWWFNLPAILKGYFDRVWAPGVAFRHALDRGRIEPLLGNLREVCVLTTFGSPRWIVELVMRNPTRRLFRVGLLAGCAPRARFRMLAHYDMDRSTPATRERFLRRVAQAFGPA